MAGFIDLFRSGGWLTRERVRLVALAVLAASLIGAGFLIVTAHGLNDRLGRPLGTDFASFYAAGTLVRDGMAASAYDHAAHFAREQAIFGSATQFYFFPYPPFFLLLAGAFALLSYPLALILWQCATLALYLLSIRAIVFSSWPGLSRPSTPAFSLPPQGVDARHEAGHDGERAHTGDPLYLLLAIAFPAVFINIGHGQNGFLTAGLVGFALVALERRPLLAGVLFGLLAYKPQFGLMIPLALLVTGQWRTIAAAAATVALLALATLAAFGSGIWLAFFASMPFTRSVVLEHGAIDWYKLQSVYSWVRMWGGSIDLAYVIQAVVTISVAAGLAWLWRSRARFALKAAALPVATLLATPFCFDYDLMLLAPAIAFLAADGFEHKFAPWMKTLLAALWIVPLLSRSVAEATLIPLTVPLLLLAFGFMLRRAMTHGDPSRLWHFAPRVLK